MMKNDAAPTPSEEKAKAKSLGKKLLDALIHNWGWKLGSIALAICLWGVLITQDSALPRTKTIEDVRVSVTNSAVLRSNGLIVVSGLEDVNTVTLRASVPQKNYTAAAAANYIARLDVSQIQTAGEQTLKITATAANATQYGTVLEVVNPDVKLVVEEYGTLSGVPVEVRRTGEIPDGIYATAVTRSVDSVDISGPKSLVEQAVRCVINYDQSTLSLNRNPNSVSLPFFFEDAEGNVLDSTNFTVNPRGSATSIQRITVTQNVYAMTRVKVDESSLLKGEPAEGYAISNIRVIPTSITLAGSEVAIAPYREEGAALFPYDPVDISGQSRTVSQLLYLNTPNNMDYISNNTVQVVVTILPEEFVKLSTDSNP
ncbi:MAG: hypothetical protein IJI53_01090 [Clostridia bacterium]|nr:hypothetical protein [Clostridia bacterium]MBR0406610.1 hypothetical protein [Clostridia bacterium]